MSRSGTAPATPPEDPTRGPEPWPQKGLTGRAIVVLLVGVVAVVGFGFGLWVAATSGHNLSNGWHVGVTVERSPDGRSWNLTFTAVPSVLSPANTSLTLLSSNGTTLLSARTLSSLTGGYVPLTGSAGTLYLSYDGRTPGMLSPEDTVSIGTTVAGTGTSTTGWVAEFVFGSSIIWLGTLH